ncbi:hypothetical protein LTR27_008196 [Elasticomyces elasticus]|nr:hypothetical protein LTR27_008196 [Elasticomyces elasticus]
MRQSVVLSLASLLCLVSCAPPSYHHGSDLKISTTSGSVTGFVNSTAPNVRQWLGIPYAAPPLGALRFAPPQAPTPHPVNASAFAPSCMQQYSNGSTIYTEVLKEFLINGGQSEDCLYLNVWAPEATSKGHGKWPVFVYVPGGGFTSGGANSLYKIPDKWVQRTQGHVVVIMNYRVNLFGFPNAKGLERQNVGLLDQRMVVEWTKKNIAAFGGNPDSIIFWGQSAGGASVSLYPYAYPKDPMVKGIAADSGSPGIAGSSDTAQSNFTFVASLVGCTGQPEVVLDCMRHNVTAAALENVLSLYQISARSPKITFGPTPDEVIVFANYTDRAAKGLVAKIPEITGSNANEGAGFVPYTPDGPGAATLFNVTERVIACPLGKGIRDRELAGLTTYRYQYSGVFNNTSPVGWFGAYHSSELPLLFGTHYEYRGDSTPYEYEVSHFMEALWLSFARDPSKAPSATLPSGDLFSWPAVTAENDVMIEIANGTNLVGLASGQEIDAYCS